MKKVSVEVLGWLGWLLCMAIPVALPIVFINSQALCDKFGGVCSSHVSQYVIGCVVFVLVLGHVLMVEFWKSLQERHIKKSAPERKAPLLGNDEVAAVRKFLSDMFGGDLRLETDYRFPNGFRGDIVAIRGRGRYPIICFEVVSNGDENRIQAAIQELRFVAKPFAGVTTCFILNKLNDGSYQFLKVRGSTTQKVVGTFPRELRDEIEDSVDRKVVEVKRSRLKFPILFLLLVVTPIIECVAILAHLEVAISGAVSTLLVFWIGAFMGVFGVGVKGYEPKVSDLMKA